MLRISARDLTRRFTTTCTRPLLATLAVFALLPVAFAQLSGTNQVLDNPGDPNFNQLLGINNGRVVVGYFGDGSIVPNNGYVLVPKNHYAKENFTNLPSGDSASQTQAIGINNQQYVSIVGFYQDSKTGFIHGFWDGQAGPQATIDDPAGSPPNVTTPAQNLLGVNDSNLAAGFWTDNNAHEHGFVVTVNVTSPSKSKFTEIPPSTFSGAVATQASNITDHNEVCGFWTDGSGNNHGFYGVLGQTLYSFDVEIGGVTATSTTPFGCNNNGEIVGTFTDGSGQHGFVFAYGAYSQFDFPGSSQTVAFGVAGTTINGINDLGDFAGFFSTGTKVESYVHFAPGNLVAGGALAARRAVK
jgi:hypothetical protein